MVRAALPLDHHPTHRRGGTYRAHRARGAGPVAGAFRGPLSEALGAQRPLRHSHPGARYRHRRSLQRRHVLGAAGTEELPATHRTRGATGRKCSDRDGGDRAAARPLLLRRAAGHAREPGGPTGRLPQCIGGAGAAAHRVLPRQLGGGRSARGGGAADHPNGARQRGIRSTPRLPLSLLRLRAAQCGRIAGAFPGRLRERPEPRLARLPDRVPPGRRGQAGAAHGSGPESVVRGGQRTQGDSRRSRGAATTHRHAQTRPARRSAGRRDRGDHARASGTAGHPARPERPQHVRVPHRRGTHSQLRVPGKGGHAEVRDLPAARARRAVATRRSTSTSVPRCRR